VPDLEAVSVDIAVDDDGRVAIGYWKTGPDHRGATVVLGGGVWTFSPTPLHEDPGFPDASACQLNTDKLAEPDLVRIGAPVTVTLRASGRCPGRYDPVQLMLVVDTSYSMSFDDAMARAKGALLDILRQLNPNAVQVGLVTFDTGGTLESRLTHDIGSVHSAVTRLGTDGDTLMGAGIELARVELTGDNHGPEAAQIIWLVSDGAFKDQPTAALEAARADGIEVFAVIFPTREYLPEHEAALIEVLGSPDRLLKNIDPQRQRGLVEYATRYVPVPGLVESITVEDWVPDNMRYEPDSASPPAVFQDGRLTWSATDISATSGLTLTYRLRPRQAGTWPTNVRADAAYVDALGYEGVIPFPVPVIDVEPARLYLPLLLQNGCARTRRPLDVFLLVDTSGSMGEPDPSYPGRTKLQAAIDAGLAFIDILNFPMDRVGLVSFDDQVVKTVELTLMHQNVEFELITMRPGVGTRIDLGLEAAATQLELTAREGVTRAVVLLSDGRQNGSREAVLEVADRLKASDVGIYTVALGQDADSDLLVRVASRADMAFVAEPSALRRVYQGISARLTCDGWRRLW
jgi:Mg-chelatase subunit ChlD